MLSCCLTKLTVLDCCHISSSLLLLRRHDPPFCCWAPCADLALLSSCPLQNRMNKLESLRLEVDSRRRTVAKLGKKVGTPGAAFMHQQPRRRRVERRAMRRCIAGMGRAAW